MIYARFRHSARESYCVIQGEHIYELEGEIFAAEPGVYGQDLNWGIRIENNYLVTKTGVQNLLNASMELV